MNPTVSICCTTFNHENYIGKCIEGFLMQQTDFPIEIFIFDDASSDATQEIVKNYAAQDARIVTFLQAENQWSQQKYGMTDWMFPSAKGKYIAICEGDDYWTDPLKLQKQVDLLENDPTLSFVFHKAERVSDTKLADTELIFPALEGDRNFGIEAFFDIPAIPTASVVFRNPAKLFPALLDLRAHSHIDFVLWCSLLEQGNAGFIDEVMSAYRVHEGGISSTKFYQQDYLAKIIEDLTEQEAYFKTPELKRMLRLILAQYIVRYYKFGHKDAHGRLFQKLLGLIKRVPTEDLPFEQQLFEEVKRLPSFPTFRFKHRLALRNAHATYFKRLAHKPKELFYMYVIPELYDLYQSRIRN